MFFVSVSPELAIPLEDSHSERFDRFWNLDVLSPVTEQRTSSVSLVALPESTCFGTSSPETAYLKRYWFPSLRDRLKGFFRNTFFRSSRAFREYSSLLILNSNGLSRVRPIAYGEERTFRLLRRAFIVTENIPGTTTLKELLLSSGLDALPLAQRRILAARLGAWTRSIHDIGFEDRGFLPRNILLHRDGDKLAFSKIDSPKARGGGKAPGTGRKSAVDLIDLERECTSRVSRQDKLRFVLAYLASPRVDSEVRALLSRLRLNVR